MDFTCSCKESAELLVKLLSPVKEVGFVRLFDPEFTDIKVHWVPHQWRFYGGVWRGHGPPVFSLAPQFFWLDGVLGNDYLLQ